MKCEGCGSSADTEFHHAGQVSWCAPLSGCNIDSIVESMLRALAEKHKILIQAKQENINAQNGKSYDEATDLFIPTHTSHKEVRKWVEEQMKLIVQEMAEMEYGF